MKILAPGFYARQNVVTPVKIGIATLVATQLMNLAFIGPFRHAGLALSIGLGACLNAGLLYYHLRRHAIYTPQPGWRAFLAKLGVALLVMGGALHLLMGSRAWWLAAGWEQRAPALAALTVAGILLYGATLFALGMRWRDFSRRGAD